MRKVNRKISRGGGGATGLLLLLAGLLLAGLLGAGGVGAAHAEDGAPTFRIVAHPGNAAAQVDREFVADAFLKKATRWPDGEAIRAVDQRFELPMRRDFSERILRRSVFAIRSYWQQRIFTGRGVPPPELESDQAVIRYVLSHRGAIGYVSANTEMGGAKVLTLR